MTRADRTVASGRAALRLAAACAFGVCTFAAPLPGAAQPESGPPGAHGAPTAAPSWGQPAAPMGQPTAPAAAGQPTQGAAPAPPPPAAPAAPAPKPAEPEPEVDASGHMGGEHRRINGHNFITPVILPSAMTNGSLASAQGFGRYVFDVPGLDFTANLLLYQQSFLAQIGIANRASIDLLVTGGAAVGSDEETIAILGAFGVVQAGGMPKVRIFTVDQVGLQMSVGLGAYYQRGVLLSPAILLIENLDAAVKAIEKGKEPKLDFSKGIIETELFYLQPALMIAEGVGPLGVQLAAAPLFGVAGTEEPLGSAMEAGGHLNFDIHALTPVVPLALTFEYALEYDFDSGESTNTFAPGLYYSGRRDFEFGGVLTLQDEEDISRIYGLLVLHYFF